MKPIQSTPGNGNQPSAAKHRLRYVLVALLATILFAAQLGGGIVSASEQPDECVVAAPTLQQARADFASECSEPRVDCDRLDSTWYCSDRVIGDAAPAKAAGDGPPSTIDTPSPDEPSPAPTTTSVSPPPTTPETTSPPTTGGPCIASGATLSEAKTVFADACDGPRVDCDPVDGTWFCSDQVIGNAAPTAPSTSVTPPQPTTTTAAPTPTTSEPPETTTTTAAPSTTTSELPSTTTTTTAPPSTTTSEPLPTTTTAAPPDLGDVHPDIVKVIDVKGRNPGGAGWADSYSVGEACYCATTFDHNIGGIVVDTPDGPKTVKEVCDALGDGPGIQGRPIYNDVQCGNGPANDAGDEDDCPGRVDIGREGCGHIGPLWDLSIFE